MQVLLKHETDRGCVCIARAPDGRFHVLWGDDSLGSADSLAGALVRASAGPLKKARDGTDVVSLGLGRDPSRWKGNGSLAAGSEPDERTRTVEPGP